MVIANTTAMGLTFPAASIAWVLIWCTPSLSAADWMDQLPTVLALPVPICSTPSNRMTVAFASAVPMNTGVAIRVRSSVLDTPVSDVGAMFATLGDAGAVVSTTTVRTADGGPVLPAISVSLAVIPWLPAARAFDATTHFPSASDSTVPRTVSPSNTVTDTFASV